MKELIMKEYLVPFAISLGFVGSLITIISFISRSAREVREDTEKKVKEQQTHYRLDRKDLDIRTERIDSIMTTLVTKEMCGFTVGHIRGELREIKAQNVMLQDTIKTLFADVREQRSDIKEILKRMPK